MSDLTKGDVFKKGNTVICVHEVWNGQVLYEKHRKPDFGLRRMPLDAFLREAETAERFTREEAMARLEHLLAYECKL